ncbi:four helix bundle protein [Ferruginibacter sp. SUN002]|uniref:four helix bundle protein n=1 Tax=Ferruginibacter sp. SUN002 TaxID=2937789 RepID=UPI003D35E656
MATIKTFEDLDVWKHAIEIATDVYLISNTTKLKQDFEMKAQIKRAACSISNNIAEGFEYDNRKDFIRFLKIAKGSAGEVRNQLIILQRINLLDEKEINSLKEKCVSVSKQLKGFITYLQKYPDKK